MIISSIVKKSDVVEIKKDTLIEDIVINFPEAVEPLMRHGIKCIECGEPIWGTLEEAAKGKGLSEVQLLAAIDDIELMIKKIKKL